MGAAWKRFRESPSWTILCVLGGVFLIFAGWIGTVFAENTSFRIENEPRMERIENKLDELLGEFRKGKRYD